MNTTPYQFGDLAGVAERGAHDDGLVAVLLVVVVDRRHALNALYGISGCIFYRRSEVCM